MSIKRAHDRLKLLIGSGDIEGLSSAKEVERLRQRWKPEKVRIVLLAESHVWTDKRELESTVRIPSQRQSKFVRFVYCLGYGENEFVSPVVDNNVGTPQYWRLFADCVENPRQANGYRRLLRSGQRRADLRVLEKIDLLNQMKERGIWLVDASVTALYRTGMPKLANGAAYGRVLRASWEEHVGPLLRECQPEKILVIGRSVSAAISNVVDRDLPKATVHVVRQPNAFMSTQERESERIECYQFCSVESKKRTEHIVREEAELESGQTFRLLSEHDMFRKLRREKRRLRTVEHDSDSRNDQIDAAINFALTAWHLTDWLWQRRKPDWDRLFGAKTKIEFQKELRRRCPCLGVCDVIANAFKHGGSAHTKEHRPDVEWTGPRFDRTPGII